MFSLVMHLLLQRLVSFIEISCGGHKESRLVQSQTVETLEMNESC